MTQLTSVSDSKTGTFACRLKVPAAGWSEGTLWGIGLAGGGLLGVEFVGGDGELKLELYNASASALLSVETTTLNGRTDSFSLLMSWDLANATIHIYANDTNVAGTPSVGPTDDTVDWTQDNFEVGSFNNTGTPGSGKGKFCVGDFYLNTDEYIDLSVEANRRKFVDASGNAVDLGSDGSTPTASQPAVFLSGATSTWHTNLGYGGGLTENGALTDCGVVEIGQPAETDTALAITVARQVAIGIAAETDSALSVSIPGDTITLTDAIDERIYQADPGDGLYELAVEVTLGGADTGWQVRVAPNGGGASVVDWTTIEAGPVSGLRNGTLPGIPKGGPYQLEARRTDDPGIIDVGVAAWLVGDLLGIIGSSSAERMRTITAGQPSASAQTKQYNVGTATWEAPAGHGHRDMLNALESVTGTPWGVINGGQGGTTIAQWSNTANSDWLAFKAAVDANDSQLRYCAIFGLMNDAAGVPDAQADLETLFASLDAAFDDGGSGNPVFVLGSLGRNESATLTQQQYEDRRAGYEAAASGRAGSQIAAHVYDQELADTQHLTGAGSGEAGTRTAQAILRSLGEVSFHRGPTFNGWTLQAGDVVRVTMSHDGGADYSNTGDLHAPFEFLEQGSTPIAFSGSVQVDETTLDLTLASTPTGSGHVLRHLYGRSPIANVDRLTVIVDDSGVGDRSGLPLERSQSVAEAAEAGLASETDTALPVSPGRGIAAGIAAETDTALPVTHARVVHVGIAVETDTALMVTTEGSVAVGQAEETDSALPVSPAKVVALGIAAETDTGIGTTPARIHALGLASETDSALIIVPSLLGQLGIAAEADAALPVQPLRRYTLGLASETDTALDVTPTNAQVVAVGIAAETDTALPAAHSKRVQVGLASESDTALAMSIIGGGGFSGPGREWRLPDMRAHWTLPRED